MIQVAQKVITAYGTSLLDRRLKDADQRSKVEGIKSMVAEMELLNLPKVQVVPTMHKALLSNSNVRANFPRWFIRA